MTGADDLSAPANIICSGCFCSSEHCSSFRSWNSDCSCWSSHSENSDKCGSSFRSESRWSSCSGCSWCHLPDQLSGIVCLKNRKLFADFREKRLKPVEEETGKLRLITCCGQGNGNMTAIGDKTAVVRGVGS